jgi:hypothetical protein
MIEIISVLGNNNNNNNNKLIYFEWRYPGRFCLSSPPSEARNLWVCVWETAQVQYVLATLSIPGLFKINFLTLKFSVLTYLNNFYFM